MFINKVKRLMLESNTNSNINERKAGSKHYSVCYYVLSYAQMMVIPETLQNQILICHAGHTGVARRKTFMRSYVYWSTMDK